MAGELKIIVGGRERKVFLPLYWPVLGGGVRMDDPRQKHGNHTWDIVIHYYACPKCGYIIENRDKYEQRLGVLQKELTCARCQKHFTSIKKP